MLHNLRSAHNVGSIFRTADAAGVACVHLVGITPSPVDRFGRERKEIAKVSLGAQASVSWNSHGDFASLCASLKSGGFSLVGVEQDSRAVSLCEHDFPNKAAYIFGSEVGGLPESVLSQCDEIIYIPQYGAKESLNVSVAAGVVLFGRLYRGLSC